MWASLMQAYLDAEGLWEVVAEPVADGEVAERARSSGRSALTGSDISRARLAIFRKPKRGAIAAAATGSGDPEEEKKAASAAAAATELEEEELREVLVKLSKKAFSKILCALDATGIEL